MRNEGRKERRIDKASVFLIMLNLGDGLCEVHHIILLVCILKFFIKKIFVFFLNKFLKILCLCLTVRGKTR